MNESLIYFGDALKALDETGRVGGYLVRFSEPGKNARKDLAGEYFTRDTFFGPTDGDGVVATFHHGLPLKLEGKSLPEKTSQELRELQHHLFSPWKTKKDSIGIWAETVLDMADEYEKAVFGMVKANKLGLSSGAVSHLVLREEDGWLKRWIIGEGAITPCPCEPLNRAVPVKSLDSVKFAPVFEEEREDAATATLLTPNSLAAKLNQHIDDLVDDKGKTRETIVAALARETGWQAKDVESLLSGNAPRPSNAKLKGIARVLDIDYDALKAIAQRDYQQTIEGMFEDVAAKSAVSRWEIEATYSEIIRKLAAAAAAAKMAGITFDLSAKMQEAATKYAALLQAHALKQIEAWLVEGSGEDFTLPAIIDSEASVKALASSDLDTHSQLTVSVLREIAKRYRGNHEGRVKAGRVLSEKNRTRIGELRRLIAAVDADLQSLLDESMPMASEAEKAKALSTYLRQQWRNRQLGATANV